MALVAGTIPKNNRMELFHRACLDAIASTAGVASSAPPPGTDFNKTDAYLNYFDESRSLLILAQLKATGTLVDTEEHVHYDLEVDAYNKLRDHKSSNVGRMLVVMELPGEPDTWASCGHEFLKLHRRVFWTHLYGAPPTANTKTQVVKIPHGNLLTAGNVLHAIESVDMAFRAANPGVL